MGQPTSPLPSSGGFCPVLSIPCPVGQSFSVDASGCTNYPCIAPAATSTSTFDLSFLTNPINLFGMSIPLWGLLAAGGVLFFVMGGRK